MTMNTPKPFAREGQTPDVLAILDELDRMRTTNQNDARRHIQESTRLGQLHAALQAKFRDQLKRQRKRAAK